MNNLLMKIHSNVTTSIQKIKFDEISTMKELNLSSLLPEHTLLVENIVRNSTEINDF